MQKVLNYGKEKSLLEVSMDFGTTGYFKAKACSH